MQDMEYVEIDGVRLPMVGLGVFSMHGIELDEVVTKALSIGYRYFDTAFRYNNETELGEILSKRRDIDEGFILISTKLSGLQYHGTERFFHFDRKSPKRALQGSLKRLSRDCVDVYLLHSPFKGFHVAYKKLLKEKEKGRIKVLGVSGFNIERLKTIKNYCGEYPMVNMIEVHPYHSSRSVVDFCNENGIGLIARSPFAHGEIIPLLNADADFRRMSDEYGKSIPQIVLRWVIQQGIVAMTRAKNEEHLRENIDVFDFELKSKDIDVINMKNKDLSFGATARNTKV